MIGIPRDGWNMILLWGWPANFGRLSLSFMDWKYFANYRRIIVEGKRQLFHVFYLESRVDTPWKIHMEHNKIEVGKMFFSFANGWFLGSNCKFSVVDFLWHDSRIAPISGGTSMAYSIHTYVVNAWDGGKICWIFTNPVFNVALLPDPLQKFGFARP